MWRLSVVAERHRIRCEGIPPMQNAATFFAEAFHHCRIPPHSLRCRSVVAEYVCICCGGVLSLWKVAGWVLAEVGGGLVLGWTGFSKRLDVRCAALCWL